MNSTEQNVNHNESKVKLKQQFVDLSDGDQIFETLKKNRPLENGKSNREKQKRNFKKQ